MSVNVAELFFCADCGRVTWAPGQPQYEDGKLHCKFCGSTDAIDYD